MAREMKNSGNIRVGLIPQSWQYSRFRYLGKLSKGQITVSNDDFEGLPIIGASEMLGKEPRVYTHNTYAPQCKESDILILWDGANAGIVANRLCGVVASTAAVYRTFKDCPLDKQYLFYNFKAAEPYFKSQSTGTTIPHMNPKYLDEFYALVPPKNEQKAIADFLDSKCSDIDGLLADLDQEIKTLADYKKSLIAETVTHGLNPSAPMKQVSLGWIEAVPEHWMLEKGKYAFALRRTKGNLHNLELLSPSQKYGVIPQSQLEGVVLVDEKTNLETFRTIHKGDFCISLRSFQGGFEYSIYEGVVSPAYQVFYPTINVCVGYFKYLFKSDGFISKINTFSMSLRDGKNIAFDDFGNMYLPIPPIEEQKAISAFLDQKLEAIESAIASKQDQIEKLKAYKASLIYEYVTGKKQVAL